MAIEINYSSSNGTHAGLEVLREQGLKAYFQHYEATFAAAQVDPDAVYQAGQAFSTAINTPVTGITANPIPPMFADLQYGGNTSLTSGEKSAFIVEAQASGPGVVVGQLAYTLFNDPSHTLGGELDIVQLGDLATLNGPGGLHQMTEPVVDITNLNSVLNGGLKQSAPGQWTMIGRNEGLVGGVNTDVNSIWYGTEYGNNDTHNIVYDLMSRHGLEEGPKETGALQHVLNWADFDLSHNGTSHDEVFDGFNGADTFKVGGGNDVILGFNSADDTVELSLAQFGYATATDAYNALEERDMQVGGITYVDTAYLESVDGLHSVAFAGLSLSDLSASDFLIA